MKPQKIDEGIYLRKDRFGYKIVYPYKNTDDTINWFNVMTGGTWWKLLKVIVIVLLILGMSYSYYHDTKACRELIKNPCNLLPNITRYCQEIWWEYPHLDSTNKIIDSNITIEGGQDGTYN